MRGGLAVVDLVASHVRKKNRLWLFTRRVTPNEAWTMNEKVSFDVKTTGREVLRKMHKQKHTHTRESTSARAGVVVRRSRLVCCPRKVPWVLGSGFVRRLPLEGRTG